MKIKNAGDLACPHCTAQLDGAAEYGSMVDGGVDIERQPEHDDVTICMYCFNPLRFVLSDGRLSLRTMSHEELVALPPDMLGSLDHVHRSGEACHGAEEKRGPLIWQRPTDRTRVIRLVSRSTRAATTKSVSYAAPMTLSGDGDRWCIHVPARAFRRNSRWN